MARFKYLGEDTAKWSIQVQGPCTEIKCRKLDGTLMTWTPVPPATEFVIGADIGYDITDPHCLRCFRADTTRFEEI